MEILSKNRITDLTEKYGVTLRFVSSKTVSNGDLVTYNLVHDETGITAPFFLFQPKNFHDSFAFPLEYQFNSFHTKYSKIHSDKFWSKVHDPIYDYISCIKFVYHVLSVRVQLSRQSEVVF